MTHRRTGKPAISISEEESLQTFTSSPCNNFYIICGYGTVPLHYFAHLVLTVSTESSSSNGTSSWADMVETMSRSSFTCKECMLKIQTVVLCFSSLNRDATDIKGGYNIAGKSHIKQPFSGKVLQLLPYLTKKATESIQIYPIYTNNATQLSCKQGLVAGHCYRNSTYFPLGNLKPHKFSPFKATEKQCAAYALVSIPSC